MEKLPGKRPDEPNEPVHSAWIPLRTGMIVIGLLSIFMTVLTAWEAVPQRGLVEGILIGLLFGGLIWVIFFGFLVFNRWIRRQ